MRGIPPGYRRVTRREKCPICGHDSWCLIAIDKATALCPRSSTGAKEEWGECGFLHVLDNVMYRARLPVRFAPRREPPPPDIDFEALNQEFQLAVNHRKLELLAASLGLTVRGMRAFGVGWCERSRATTFPMKDENGKVIGIRLRSHCGRKWAVKGSRSGLFYADSPEGQGRILVPEGPTDSIALYDLGFYPVGRPFCSGGWEFIEGIARREQRDWVIVTDRDGPGVKSAEKGADRIIRYSRTTRLIYPLEGKDARQWVREGATRDTVRAVIDNAKLWIRRAA